MTPIVLDTNVLLRLAEPNHRDHVVVADAVELLRRSKHRLVLLPQVVYEFWAVATRTVQANGLGLSAIDADRLIDEFTRRIPVLRDERGVYERWRELARQHQVPGARSFDMRIVAAMIRHQIRKLLTSNTADFARYQEIEALSPHDVLATV